MSAWRRVITERPSLLLMLGCLALFYTVLFTSPRRDVSQSPVERKQVEVHRAEVMKAKEEAFRQSLLKDKALFSSVTFSFLLVLLLGTAVDLFAVLRKNSGLRMIPHGRTPLQSSWGWGDLLEVLVFVLFAEASVNAFMWTAGRVMDLKSANQDVLIFANNLARNAAILWYLVWFLRRRLGRPLAEIGLHTENIDRNIVTGVLAYVGILPPLFLILLLLMGAASLFSYEPPPQPVVEVYLKSSSEPHLIFFTFFVAVFGPLVEEVVFRGFIYGALRRKLGVGWGMVTVSAVFGMLHMNPYAFLPIFFLGLFLNYLYERTGSLVPSITAHVLHNFLMVGMTMLFKTFSA